MTQEQIFQQKFNELFNLINNSENTELKIKLNNITVEIMEELSAYNINLFADNKNTDNLELNYSELIVCYTPSEVFNK